MVKNLHVLTAFLLTFFIFQNASAQNCAGNLFNNSGFEQDFGDQIIGNGWEGYGGTSFSTDAHSGQRAVQLAISDYRRIWQFIPAQPGQEYTASGYLKSNSHGTIGIKFLTADYQPDNLLTSRATNGNYTLVELTRTAPANAAWVEVSIYSNADHAVLADDFCLTVGGGNTSDCSLATNVNVTPCDDRNTTDPSDDMYNFVVDVTPTNGGTGYTAEWIENGAQRIFNRTYPVGIGQPFNLISTGTLTLTLTDNADPNCTTTVDVVPPAPCSGSQGNGGDLKLTATGSPATIAAWSFGSSTFEITNEGTETLSGIEVSFDLHASAKLKGGDEYTASQGTLQSSWTQVPVWNVGSLAPGQTETIQLNIFTLAGGEMPIYGQVSAATGNDSDSTPNNGTPPNPNEDDEAVFTFNGGNTGTQPDLTFGTLFINNAPSAGEVLNYNFNLINAGTATASGNYSIKSYISKDNVLSNDDIQDGIIITGNTPVGTINTVPGASTLPANLPQGNYYLILKIDADDQITESNEGNNLVSAPFTTQNNTNLPDLVVQNVTSRTGPEVFIGQGVSAYFDAVNLGEPLQNSNFPITYSLYMSSNQTLDGNDYKILDLGLGIGNMIQFGGQVPPNLTPGDYYLIVEIDSPNNIAETNEGNNWTASTQTVSAMPVGSSCAFVKSHQTPGFDPPSTSRSFQLAEDASGYTISTVIQTSFNPRTIVTREHKLGLNGGLISVEDFPVPPGLPPFVDLEVRTDEKLEMVFQEGSDLPVGTRVMVDVGNADPTDIIAPTYAYRTANGGYAFGLGIIDTDMSPILKNIVIITDNVGQNAQLYELPNPDFYTGFLPSIEGPDGSLFFRLTTSGNYSLYGVPAGGNAWNYRVASDTPSSTWRYTELSDDGQYIYTAKTDNFQTVVAKIEVATGNPISLDLADLKIPSPGGSYRQNYAQGITPTSDGGIVLSMGFNEVTGNPRLSGVIVAKYDAAGNQVWKNEFFTPQYNFTLTPVGETSDGGILFVGTNNRGTNDNTDDEAIFVKIAANGALNPLCVPDSSDGADLELSFAPLANPNPAQWSFFPVTLTMKNNGTETVTNAEVQFTKADEVVYHGGNEYTASQGTFYPAGVKNAWFAGDLAPGEMATLTVNYFRLSANPFTAYAQVFNMDQDDVDSTPQNGNCCVSNEDDEAVLQIGNSANSVNNRTAVSENLGNEVFAIVGANPNPTSGRFNLEVYSNETQTSEITVIDILGKPIFRKAIELNEGNNSIPIDLENRGAGMMIVKMTPFHPYLRQIRVMKVRD